MTEQVETVDEEITQAEADLEQDDTSFEDAEDVEETEEDTEETEEESEEEESETEEPPKEDTDPEAERKEKARRAYEEREAKRKEREASKQEQHQKYLDDASDDTDRALREVRLEAYIGRIERNSDRIQTGLDKAVANIDLLTKGTPEQKEALEEAYQDYLNMYVVTDQNGDPVEVKADVYDYLQKKADTIKRLTGVGERNGAKAKTTARARTDTISTRPPKQGKKDEMLDGFDEEAGRW